MNDILEKKLQKKKLKKIIFPQNIKQPVLKLKFFTESPRLYYLH